MQSAILSYPQTLPAFAYVSSPAPYEADRQYGDGRARPNHSVPTVLGAVVIQRGFIEARRAA